MRFRKMLVLLAVSLMVFGSVMAAEAQDISDGCQFLNFSFEESQGFFFFQAEFFENETVIWSGEPIIDPNNDMVVYIEVDGSRVQAGVPGTVNYIFPETGIYTVRIGLDGSGTALLTSSCGAAGPLPSNPDNRLNWQYGSVHLGIVYPSDAGLGLYDYATEDYIANFVTFEDIEEYIGNPPENNTLIAEFGPTRFYAMQDFGFMVVIGPGPEGKEYRVRFDDDLRTVLEEFYFDPNE